MKKLRRILSLAIVMVLIAGTVSFADMEITRTYPEDGYKNATIDNFGVKIFFSEPVEITEENAKCFSITDPDGKEMPAMAVASGKDDGLVLVLADFNSSELAITQDTEYKVKVSKNVTSVNGNTLGADKVISITTLNQTKSSRVNMLIMVGMMFVMIFMTVISTKRQAEAEAKKKSAVNPYKEAKKSGKSVEDIVNSDQKRKEKAAAKAAKAAEKEAELMAKYDIRIHDPYHQRVHGPRPISAAGSTRKSGKKAIAEAEKARKAAEAAKRAKQAKKKGKK